MQGREISGGWRLLDSFTRDLERPVRGHIVALDSLRGLAAAIVVLDHFSRFWLETGHPAWMDHVREFPLEFAVNGGSAVILFFMLSGFVLTLPALAGKQAAYPSYAIRRICRIYLPYLVALGLAVLGCRQFHGRMLYGHEFQMMWRSAPDVRTVGQHVLFLGVFDAFAYDPPVWSLVHEMRISLIFPLLTPIGLRLRWWAGLLVAVGFPVAAALPRLLFHTRAGAGDAGRDIVSWLATLGYCGVFLLGSLLARYEEPIRRWMGGLRPAGRWMGLGIALALYQFPGKLHVPWPVQNFATGLGAAYVMVLAQTPHGWLSRMLHWKSFRFTGRVSYSLYLLHLPILLALSIAAYGRMPYGYLLVPFVAISLAVAAVFHQVVEEPAMRLGRAPGKRCEAMLMTRIRKGVSTYWKVKRLAAMQTAQ
jgi:peptidoglycan/LPS O-acetylase OafA/YrhL